MVLENLVTTIGPSKIPDYISNPKGSRQFQQFIKLGSKEHRNAAIAALSKNVPDLAMRNIYALITLEKIITYGLKTDESFTTEKWLKPVMTNRKTIDQLLFHRLGCKFLNKLYLHPAIKPALKKQMMSLILVPRTIELLGESKEKLRAHYLESVKKCVDKELLNLAVIQKLFRQAIEVDFAEDSKFAEEVLSMCADGLPHMLSSRDGVVVIVKLMGMMSAKHKKNFIKELKGKFHEIAKQPVTMVVLLRLLQCTDDTVLIGKSVLTELVGSDYQKGRELLLDPIGRTAFQFILDGLEFKTGKAYNSQDRDLIKQSPVTTSLKSNESKALELSSKVVPSLLKICSIDVGELLEADSMLLVSLVRSVSEESDQITLVNGIMETASETIATEEPSQNGINAVNALLKELPLIAGPIFMSQLVRLVGASGKPDVIPTMCETKAAFVLLQSLKTEGLSAHVKGLILRAKNVIDTIKTVEHKGVDLIMKELAIGDQNTKLPSLEETKAMFPVTQISKKSKKDTEPSQKKQKTTEEDTCTQLFADDDEEDEELWGIVGDDDEF